MPTETLQGERSASVHDPEDEQAELIASLTEQDAERLWSVMIQMKPHLQD
jgi:hypothetical protein